MSVMRYPLNLKVVIFEKARTMFCFFLALSRISLMRWVGASLIPEVSEPSKRIRPLVTVFESIVCCHLSRRLAIRVGICRRLGEPLWLCS